LTNKNEKRPAAARRTPQLRAPRVTLERLNLEKSGGPRPGYAPFCSIGAPASIPKNGRGARKAENGLNRRPKKLNRDGNAARPGRYVEVAAMFERTMRTTGRQGVMKIVPCRLGLGPFAFEPLGGGEPERQPCKPKI
jgi:hypothetical protein